MSASWSARSNSLSVRSHATDIIGHVVEHAADMALLDTALEVAAGGARDETANSWLPAVTCS